MSLRWAARYAFSDDLWRSKARVVLDPALEDVLVSGMPDGEDAEPLRELVDALLPAREGAGPVWMAVSDAALASRLGRLRPGTRFVALEQLPEVLETEAWETALLDLDAATATDADGNAATEALQWLGLSPDPARNVVLWASALEGGLGYEDLAEGMLERLWASGVTQRIYGLYQPPMAAVVDFGESLEVDDHVDLEITLTVQPSELRGEPAEDEDIPLYFDNSLGAQDPKLDELLGVSTSIVLPEGLGLVELPGAAGGRPSGMRAQLVSAQHRAERAEVERQKALDRLDALQRENRELREAVESGPDPFDALARDEALEAAMAREQALKWKVSGLEHQLNQAVARPVEALEAEVARLESAGAGSAAEPVAVAGDFEALDGDALGESVVVLVRDAARDEALAAALWGLVRRLERGGIGVLALRRELDALARRLRG